jgi:hypothetical protein
MKAFVVEATDHITSRVAIPIWNHELLTALGYTQETTMKMGNPENWK